MSADRIGAAFAASRVRGRATFVAYLVAGYPTPDAALAAATAVLDAGADILEIGVPFSDPVADGPVIAAASQASVAAGSGLHTAVELARQLRRRRARQPLMAMTYLNPLLAGGSDEALAALAGAGVDGVIIPDLPVGEDPGFERVVSEAGLRISFLVAPNTAPERIEMAINQSTAFVYVVPLFGVTGVRQALAEGAAELVRRIAARSAGRAPIVAGFGISTGKQVSDLAQVGDGVAVGSALVRTLADGNGLGVSRLAAMVGELSAACARRAVPEMVRR